MRRTLFALSVGLTGLGITGADAAPRVPSVKPPAPQSPYISKVDEARLRGVFDALERRQYDLAGTLKSQVEGPVAKSVAQWAYLRSSADDISPLEIDAFLDRHDGWPNDWTLRNKAEEEFDDDTPPEVIFAFFDGREPLTGEGQLQLARAYLATGKREEALREIRAAWIDNNWSAREERMVLDRYGAYLTPEDHWAKADRQLFDIRATDTKRLLDLLPADRRREAEARIALLRLDPNGLAIYRSLPQDSRTDSGVLHAITRYHRRRGDDSDAIAYAGLAPLDAEELRDPNTWYYERARLVRWCLKNARFEDAYILSAYSGLDEGVDFAEAEFMAGWIALRFLNQPERAKAHFAFLGSGVTSPISLSRGEYWLARAYDAAGEQDRARHHYLQAAAFPYNFYGQLAIEALGEDAPRLPFPEKTEIDAADLTIFESRPMAQAMHILSEVGESLHFDRFARALDDELESVGEVQAYYDLVIGERKTYLAVRAGKVARNKGIELPSVIYPLYHVPDEAARYVEKPLILGLSRQESEFNPRAYSRARARGMMQLLSSTAQITARKEGIPYSTARLMDDPSYNLTLGAAHLSHLLERFDGSYIMVMGAYNAGPNRVDQWIETYGDPRSPNVDPIDWIELVPFSETRNYIMRVTENTQVYRARLKGEALGTGILEDITRGGGAPTAIGVTPPSPRLMVQASLTDPEPTFGQNALNIPSRKTLAQEVFEGLRFPPLHDAAIESGDDPEAEYERGTASDAVEEMD